MEPQPAAADAAQQQSRQQSAFPPPPPYFRLFRDFASNAASAAASGVKSKAGPTDAGDAGRPPPACSTLQLATVEGDEVNGQSAAQIATAATADEAGAVAEAAVLPASPTAPLTSAAIPEAGPTASEAQSPTEAAAAAAAEAAQPGRRPEATAGNPASVGVSCSTASRQFPLQPPPLPGDDATFQIFGELHTAKPGIPPLAVKQLYETSSDGTVDFPRELRRLNRELLFAYVDMLSAVAARPSQSARSVEMVGVLIRNIQHLLNLLRPHQAAATLEHMLNTELEEQRVAISDLRAHSQRCRQLVLSASQSLCDLDDQGGRSGQNIATPMDTDTVVP